MFAIDFGSQGGGRRTFNNIGQLIDYIGEQISAWENDADFQAVIGSHPVHPADQLRAFWHRWSTLRNQLGSYQQQFGGDEAQIAASFQNVVSSSHATSRSSAEGTVVAEMASRDGPAAAYGALRLLSAQPTDDIVTNMPKAQFEGLLSAWARLSGLDTKSAATSRDALRRLANEMDAREAARISQMEEARDQLRERNSEIVSAIEAAGTEFGDFRNKAEALVHEDRARWEAEWEAKRDLYIEQLKIRAAVSQWTERADGHERTFVTQRRWAIGIGVAGLLIAICWVMGALSLAHWLFSDALVTGKLKEIPGTLRATWPQELIFAASASLLYLTLFLWTMRLLVRMMMSEHHLGIDARSRASMAHTYLALMEEKAASSDADRAIVLAALFRPVTDGLVKDDALPMISPATILSGGLAGKP